jgi:hypothetical protein
MHTWCLVHSLIKLLILFDYLSTNQMNKVKEFVIFKFVTTASHPLPIQILQLLDLVDLGGLVSRYQLTKTEDWKV